MKTIALYILTATLINAGMFMRDIGVLALGALLAVLLYQHSKTLKLRPMTDPREQCQPSNSREM